jgi:hypothetical protein
MMNRKSEPGIFKSHFYQVRSFLCRSFKNYYFCSPKHNNPQSHTQLIARVAEVVDALVSGTSVLTNVQVRVLSRAQNNRRKNKIAKRMCFAIFVGLNSGKLIFLNVKRIKKE